MVSLNKIIAILIGSVLIAIGINFFLVPLGILDGGVIGIALIINYLFDIRIGLVMILCSIPIFILAWFYSRDLLYYSISGLLFSSYMIDLLEPYQYYFIYYVEWTAFTRSIIGGFIIGTGMGIMLRFESSTGGTDLLAHFVTRLIPLNVGFIILMIDLLIISIGEILLPDDTLFLSFMTITAGGLATSICTMNRPKMIQ
ncbi:YitT family protein [Paenibacillus alkaliterrae]|uniref:YitT family protein n=1 Tax=Paenibacillus alkaliterrae TaxID=320909 RepID=UPI001F44F2D8|nr:YitT family protein [Paenibacillus alkaliterrae]MCF2940174.1 YitT family protein [Paenibacillus alkaliterrae]